MKKSRKKENLHYSKLAIASLIIGGVTILLGFHYFPANLILSVLSFVTGILALKDINKNRGAIKGRIFAWIGITVSSIQIILVIMEVVIIFMINTCVNNAFSRIPVPYKNAIKHMDKTDLAYFNSKISKIRQDNSEKDVEMLLGQSQSSDSYGDFILYGYDCPKPSIKHCSIHVIFRNHTTQAIVWFNDITFWFGRSFDESDKAYFNGEPNAPIEGWLDYILPPTREECFP